MPLAVQCPSCSTKLNAPDAAAGKRVKCPKCATPVPVPAADDGFEVVEDAPPPKKATSGEVRKARPRDEDDEGDRPRRKKKPVVEADDDEDDAPRSRRRRDDDDEEEDDRPRKGKGKRKAAARKGPPLPLLIGGGVGAVVLIGVVLFFVFGRSTGPGGAFGPATPAGYTAFRESGIGLAVFLPGQASGSYVRQGGPNGPPNPDQYVGHSSSGRHDVHFAAHRKAGYKPGSGADELFGAFEKGGFFLSVPRKYDVIAREPVTLGGKQGLKVVVKEKPDLWDKTPQDAEFFKDSNQRERDRVAKDGVSCVAYVVPSGEWLYLINIAAKGGDPDPEVLKTIAESIKVD